MTCLWPYEMLYFFLTLCFIVAKFCVLAHLIIWMHTNYFFTLTVALWIVIFPQKFCVVYLNLTGYQIKAWNIDLIYILMNEN